MSTEQPQNPGPLPFGPKEAAEALNEHGFLFQQVIRNEVEILGANLERGREGWNILANEYPVTAVDGTPTRIDLVLRSQQRQGVYICLECKRPNPKYKTWLFFDQEKALPNVWKSAAFLESIKMEEQSGGCGYFLAMSL